MALAVPNTLWMEAAGADPLSAMAHSWAVADIPRMAAKGTSPVRSCRGYRSAPRSQGRQAHMATLKGLHEGLAILPLLCLCLVLQH